MYWVRGSVVGRGNSSVVHLAFNPSYPSATFVIKSASLASASLLQYEETILTDLHGCPQIISCFGHHITIDPIRGRIECNYDIFLKCVWRLPLRHNLSCRWRSTCANHSSLYPIHPSRPTPHICHGYVHCDIKPQNILIIDGEAKIADFRLAKKASEEFDEQIRGSPMYMAPESPTRKEYEAATDIWAFGCTVAEMVSGQPPWRRDEESQNGVWTLLM